jgi:hypothetical protein
VTNDSTDIGALHTPTKTVPAEVTPSAMGDPLIGTVAMAALVSIQT